MKSGERKRRNNGLLKDSACRMMKKEALKWGAVQNESAAAGLLRATMNNQSHASSNGDPGWAFQKGLSDLRAQLPLTAAGLKQF